MRPTRLPTAPPRHAFSDKILFHEQQNFLFTPLRGTGVTCCSETESKCLSAMKLKGISTLPRTLSCDCLISGGIHRQLLVIRDHCRSWEVHVSICIDKFQLFFLLGLDATGIINHSVLMRPMFLPQCTFYADNHQIQPGP